MAPRLWMPATAPVAIGVMLAAVLNASGLIGLGSLVFGAPPWFASHRVTNAIVVYPVLPALQGALVLLLALPALIWIALDARGGPGWLARNWTTALALVILSLLSWRATATQINIAISLPEAIAPAARDAPR